jgi:hypothetical protein
MVEHVGIETQAGRPLGRIRLRTAAADELVAVVEVGRLEPFAGEVGRVVGVNSRAGGNALVLAHVRVSSR